MPISTEWQGEARDQPLRLDPINCIAWGIILLLSVGWVATLCSIVLGIF